MRFPNLSQVLGECIQRTYLACGAGHPHENSKAPAAVPRNVLLCRLLRAFRRQLINGIEAGQARRTTARGAQHKARRGGNGRHAVW